MRPWEPAAADASSAVSSTSLSATIRSDAIRRRSRRIEWRCEGSANAPSSACLCSASRPASLTGGADSPNTSCLSHLTAATTSVRLPAATRSAHTCRCTSRSIWTSSGGSRKAWRHNASSALSARWRGPRRRAVTSQPLRRNVWGGGPSKSKQTPSEGMSRRLVDQTGGWPICVTNPACSTRAMGGKANERGVAKQQR